ncbi:hypothetical protein [Brachybacterium sp. YJGR34]|uniref:hypothetical protein n=1 Tax=Brachybacterium sp. YJGR34 TaxID=2059911 RepID=UPI001E59434A|nr:hypothetical protein [Brachybacterium sp. YJGR34]
MGLSAARLLHVPLPRRLETWTSGTPVHLAVPGGYKGSDTTVRWHNITLAPADLRSVVIVHPGSLAIVNGSENASIRDLEKLPVRITSYSRTWRDLAGHLSHDALVAVGDHLVRTPRPRFESGRRAPRCTVEELAAQCTGRHASALRSALADVRVGADSPRETFARLAFLRAGLPEPQINVPLIGEDGVARHAPDFQWARYRVAAEYDGRTHSDDDQVARDIARARRVREAGWTEVRLHAADARNSFARAVQLVRAELRAQGWTP